MNYKHIFYTAILMTSQIIQASSKQIKFNKYGEHALHLMAHPQHSFAEFQEAISRFPDLIDRQSSTNHFARQVCFSNTPAHHCAFYEQWKKLEYLIASGARVNIKDAFNNTIVGSCKTPEQKRACQAAIERGQQARRRLMLTNTTQTSTDGGSAAAHSAEPDELEQLREQLQAAQEQLKQFQEIAAVQIELNRAQLTKVKTFYMWREAAHRKQRERLDVPVQPVRTRSLLDQDSEDQWLGQLFNPQNTSQVTAIRMQLVDDLVVSDHKAPGEPLPPPSYDCRHNYTAAAATSASAINDRFAALAPKSAQCVPHQASIGKK